MKLLPRILFWLAIGCIVLSLGLLAVFSLNGITGALAAYTVGGCAIAGGTLLIVSTLLLFFRKDTPGAWQTQLSFHLPELLGFGLLMVAFGIILCIVKMLKAISQPF